MVKGTIYPLEHLRGFYKGIYWLDLGRGKPPQHTSCLWDLPRPRSYGTYINWEAGEQSKLTLLLLRLLLRLLFLLLLLLARGLRFRV